MKQNRFTEGVQATYESPATRIYDVRLKSRLLYTSDRYGVAGGNPEEDDESVLD